MFVGIDIGTTSVKSVLMAEDGTLHASASFPVPVSRPRAGWSEQDPDHWWSAVCDTLDALAAAEPRLMAGVPGIGVSGHMHGATLLGAADAVLRREDAHLRSLAYEVVGDRPGAANFLEAEAMGTDAVVGGAEVLAEEAKEVAPHGDQPMQGAAIRVESKADQLRTTADLARDRAQGLIFEEEDPQAEEEDRRRRDGTHTSLGL